MTGRNDPVWMFSADSKSPLAAAYYRLKWHKEKTMISSGEKSHSPKAAVPINRITGPFAARQSSEIGFEIVGGDGTVPVWVVGQWNADVITALLNLAHKRGDLEGDK